MKAKHNIKPIYDINSQILILGTMPSQVSREAKFYYAHPQNRFWPIMEDLFSIKLLTTQDKIDFLIKNHIALWDVCSSCDIKASSDASIKNVTVNDITKIITKANIKCIFCTGKTSYNLFKKYFDFKIPVIYLPSPSSANAAQSFNKLKKEYSIILDYIH